MFCHADFHPDCLDVNGPLFSFLEARGVPFHAGRTILVFLVYRFELFWVSVIWISIFAIRVCM